jgi:hypothetical protein
MQKRKGDISEGKVKIKTGGTTKEPALRSETGGANRLRPSPI